MSALAKFRVHSVTRYEGGVCGVNLRADTSDSGNESWSKWTPQGDISMTITVPEAADQFIPGKSYIVEFYPVTAG